MQDSRNSPDMPDKSGKFGKWPSEKLLHCQTGENDPLRNLCSQVILSFKMSSESLKCPAKNLKYNGHFVRRVTKSFQEACQFWDPTIGFYPWISRDCLQFAIRVKMVGIPSNFWHFYAFSWAFGVGVYYGTVLQSVLRQRHSSTDTRMDMTDNITTAIFST